MDSENLHRFEDYFKNFTTGMLVTHNRGKQLRGRPMHILCLDNSNNIWLSSTLDSEKIKEIGEDSRVALVCQSGSNWISITGNASVITDKEKKEELWSESLRIYFPEGKNSEEYALIRIETLWAEFWDFSGVLKTLQFIFEAGKAYLTKQKMDPEKTGKHNKVTLGTNEA